MHAFRDKPHVHRKWQEHHYTHIKRQRQHQGCEQQGPRQTKKHHRQQQQHPQQEQNEHQQQHEAQSQDQRQEQCRQL
eukprot:13415618-Alexandrium_andersonii.AAC.1